MRKFYLYLFPVITYLFLIIGFTSAQNVGISLQVDNSGKVLLGGSTFIRVQINNTSSSITLVPYRIRPRLNFPAFLSLAADGHILPAGWKFIATESSYCILSNGTATMPPNSNAIIFIRMNGNQLGGPLAASGQILFSNGQAPGTSSGPSTSGNIQADDASAIFLEVVSSLPVTLSEFNASLVNCKGLLQWTTRTEVNSDRFEVEKTTQVNGHWTSIGAVKAAGTSYREKKYSFVDNSLHTDATGIFYRLKTIDLDGSFRYSNTVMIVNTCRFTKVLTYPNPVENGKLYINLTELEGKLEGSLINTSGQVARKVSLFNGANTLPVTGLAGGIYQFVINNESGIVYRTKIMIQK